MANRIAPGTNGALAETETALRMLGAEFSAGLTEGAIVSLEGPMGAGKTCFVQGMAHGLGLDANDVSSPTFPILHEYGGGRLLHFDLYRLQDAGELASVGWDDAIASGDICAIEWGDRFPSMLPAGTLHLIFEIVPEGRRVRLREPLQ